MEVKIIIDVEQEDEPVSLAEAKAYLRIDPDYYANDQAVLDFITSARERLEKFTNLSFAPKTLLCQFSESYFQIPYGPVNDIEILTDNQDPPVEIEADKYRVEGLDFKTISFDHGYDIRWFYNLNGSVYPWSWGHGSCILNLTYKAGYGYEDGTPLPRALKTAILIQVNEDYKNLGNPYQEEICELAKRQARPYSRNLVVQ